MGSGMGVAGGAGAGQQGLESEQQGTLHRVGARSLGSNNTCLGNLDFNPKATGAIEVFMKRG